MPRHGNCGLCNKITQGLDSPFTLVVTEVLTTFYLGIYESSLTLMVNYTVLSRKNISILAYHPESTGNLRSTSTQE